MIDRDDLGSWLDGPKIEREPGDWPGKRLGLPESGRHSLAPAWRRILALLVDWLMCLAIANVIDSGNPFLAPGIFALEQFLLVATLGYSVGHRIFGIEVRRLDGHVPGLLKSLIRAVLVVLVIPALIFDRDNRGLHDLAAGTVILRR
ncbi:MAG: RDD family protein [Brevibacterium sp.]|uniref:RDD family protein n=1 Tax=unclassified Brevibacterium TaxID=2614124 RepID=UPI001E28A8C0|nr:MULTISPECIES: RDD family protein [unclassified Brevibacterium]MCD1284798.1 RDD family protein [Brevibacterium sp. CCUG 69071]MDK8435581.1 RDD family protein [Brevibacterium sp. H-BE7]